MSEKVYTITQPQIAELANAIALLDGIKNCLPSASPDVAEAAVRANRCHAILEAVLYDDAPIVYPNQDAEEIAQ